MGIGRIAERSDFLEESLAVGRTEAAPHNSVAPGRSAETSPRQRRRQSGTRPELPDDSEAEATNGSPPSAIPSGVTGGEEAVPKPHHRLNRIA
jgi:hypothetical protein